MERNDYDMMDEEGDRMTEQGLEPCEYCEKWVHSVKELEGVKICAGCMVREAFKMRHEEDEDVCDTDMADWAIDHDMTKEEMERLEEDIHTWTREAFEEMKDEEEKK